MKLTFAMLLLSSSLEARAATLPKVTTVLLELFTSEGCSSCPPADVLLARLEREQPIPGVEVVPLSLHVDYWNRLGWKDPFSQAVFSERQQAYAARAGSSRVYTPQVVVDGAREVVGSDDSGVRSAIAAAARQPRVRVVASLQGVSSGSARLRVSVEGSEPLPKGADVLLALTEQGLASQVTRGENAGRRLPHTAVVRSLARIGRLDGPGSTWETTSTIPLGTASPGNLHAVAFVQEAGQGRVLGAARVALGERVR